MTPAGMDALRVTVLDAINAASGEELGEARSQAEATFKAAMESTGFRASTGALQVDITLPGGQVIGHLSVKAGGKTKTTDDIGLHEWIAERNPDGLEEFVPGAALADPRVLALLREHCPDLLSSRVREGTRKAYLAEALKVTENAPKGWLFDPATGERLQLVTETQETATGAFAFVGAETVERRKQVMASLAAGDPVVRSIAFGGQLAIGPETDDSGLPDAVERKAP